MINSNISENDLESPGYEYLRSYQSMSNLYQKLVALGYQREFCSIYRCPQIHKYYFSLPSRNQSEQQFLYTCLCAWLIKDKCQMNFELEPEEYEDPDIIIGIIMDAVRLLLTPENASGEAQDPLRFPPGRLRHGYGPEVIWTMNVLTDRAMELQLRARSLEFVGTSMIFHDISGSVTSRRTDIQSISIGQPYVGGGLTTRPLGNYQVDDSTLLFDSIGQNEYESSKTSLVINDVSSEDWYAGVDKIAQSLRTTKIFDLKARARVISHLERTIDSSAVIKEFLGEPRVVMDNILSRIDRHLQLIAEREHFIQTSTKVSFEEFIHVWRTYSGQKTRQENLLSKVNSRTDEFELANKKLSLLSARIETRLKELNDGARLKDLTSMINKLKEENVESDVKIGLLLTVYAKMESKIISSNNARI